MPPRRSSRAAATKQPEPAPAKDAPKKTAAATKVKAAPAKAAPAKAPARGRTQQKRPSTPESSLSPPPPAKRRRAASKAADVSAPVPEPKPKPASKKVEKSSSQRSIHVQSKPYFNPLPAAPEHLRPAPVLFMCGAGNFGQFGAGEDVLDEIEKPQRNKLVEKWMEEGKFGEPGAGFEDIAGGGMFSLFVDEKGTVWSCGTNDDAALGRITTEVPNPEKEGELLDIDTLTAQPWPLQSLLDEKFRAVKIAAGDSIAAAISSEGELRAWGSFRSNEGLLGFSSGHKHQWLPAPILELKSKPGDVEKFTNIAAGNNHLVVLTTHGNVYTWGAGEQGQLGRRVLERRKIHGTVPEKIVLGSHRKAVAIGAGNYASFAIDEGGGVWGWGLNNMGQIGTGNANEEVGLPKKVVGLSEEELGDGEKVVQIAGGEHHTLFRTNKGRVFGCGRANGGQLGLSDEALTAAAAKAAPPKAAKSKPEPSASTAPAKEDESNAVPDQLAVPAEITFPAPTSDDPIVHIAAGIHNNLAISRDGALYTWGTGPQSELGVKDESEVRTPREVVKRTGGSWKAILGSCGGQHTLALLQKKT